MMTPTHPMAPRGRRSEQAFTITEVLISVFVLAIGLIGVISIFPVGISATQTTLDNSAAALAANTAVAELQYMLQVQGFAGAVTVYPVAGGAGNDPADHYDVGVNKYRWNAVLAPVPDDTSSVSWGALVEAAGSDNRLVLAQVAFFRGDQSAYAGTATFVQNSASVSLGTIPTKFDAGVYMRRTSGVNRSRWYLVDGFDRSSSAATLTEAYAQAGETGEFAFTKHLYQTLLTAP